MMRSDEFHTDGLRVGLDITTLRFPHTGIAVYTLHLIRAIQNHLNTGLALVGFDGFGFRPLRDDFVAEELSRNDRRRNVAAGAFSPLSSSAYALLRQGGVVRKFSRRIKEWAFEREADRLDLFHATVTFPPGRTRTPLIPLVHDLSLLRHPETHPIERVRAFDRWKPVITCAPVINTVSQFSKNEIASMLGVPRDQIIVTRPGVDSLFFGAGDPAVTSRVMREFDVMPRKYILSVGSIEPRKNLPVVLEAFAAIPAERRRQVRMLVVGPSGWGNVRIPEAARRLCDDGTIRLTGYVDRVVLRTLYSETALFVYPSLYEGFGIPAAEALACGAPVAVSSGSSLDEVVGIHGIRLPPDDTAGWRDAMEDALAACDLPDAAARTARREWAAQFDWDKTAAETLAMYRMLLPRRATAAIRSASPDRASQGGLVFR